MPDALAPGGACVGDAEVKTCFTSSFETENLGRDVTTFDPAPASELTSRLTAAL